jgi:hypothetical protein
MGFYILSDKFNLEDEWSKLILKLWVQLPTNNFLYKKVKLRKPISNLKNKDQKLN